MPTRMLFATLLLISCSEVVRSGGQVSSPDGRVEAVFEARGGGGAAGWLYQYVSVGEPGDPHDVLVLKGAPSVCLEWSGASSLEVRFGPSAELRERRSPPEFLLPLEVVERRMATPEEVVESCAGRVVSVGAARSL